MGKVVEIIKTFMANVGLFILSCLMTNHTKRFMLLTSLHVQLVKEGILQEESLSNLNSAMNLVRYVDALEFPSRIHDRIWGHAELGVLIRASSVVDLETQPMSFTEARALSLEIVKRSPTWLLYGEEGVDMVRDLIAFFYCTSEIGNTNAAV